jgi:hypothetical protein
MTTLAAGFRRMTLPLAVYYGVTLVIPLANGAPWADAAFLRHTFMVLTVPPAGIALVCAAAHCLRFRTDNAATHSIPTSPLSRGQL